MPDGLTEEERREWIQTYIDSITPNRVDYKKTPTRSIITKLPRNSIFQPKEDPKLNMLMEKFKEPVAKIVQRIDYEKHAAEEEAAKAADGVDLNVCLDAATGTSDAADFELVVPAITYEEFLSQQDKSDNKETNTDLDNPSPGTSKQEKEDVEFDCFVTKRRPARKRQEDV